MSIVASMNGDTVIHVMCGIVGSVERKDIEGLLLLT